MKLHALESQIQAVHGDLSDAKPMPLYLMRVRGDWLLADKPHPGARKIGEFTKTWWNFDTLRWVPLSLTDLRAEVYGAMEAMRPA